MDLYSKAESSNAKKDFIELLSLLRKDFVDNKESWENQSIDMFLGAIKSWIEDYSGEDINWEQLNWKSVSAMFYMGKIYE